MYSNSKFNELGESLTYGVIMSDPDRWVSAGISRLLSVKAFARDELLYTPPSDTLPQQPISTYKKR